MQSRRRFLSSLSAGAISLAGGASWGGKAAAANDSSATLAWPLDVTGWDPSANSSPATLAIHKCVFDTPLEISTDFKLSPGVASSYRWLDKDGKTLELVIREGIKFHNGDLLTADDFRFTFYDRPKADRTLNISGTFGNIVSDVEVASPHKVIFHFNESYLEGAPLLATTTPYILPRRYFEQVGRDGFVAKPVGSGPYRLIDYQRNTLISLEAFPDYWRGAANIKRVSFRIVPDVSARVAAVQSGQVDYADNIPVREVNRLGALPNLVGQLPPTTVSVLIHMVNKGIYQDRNLRLAMHHAIDKEALSKAFYGAKAIPQMMYAAKGLPGNDPTFSFPYDRAKARALLAQSGYGPDNPIKIQFGTLNGNFTGDFDVARALVQMWKQVGIDAELKVFELAHYFELSRNGKLEHPVLYAWSDTTGDPIMMTGLLLDPKKRYSIWKSDDIPGRLYPLLREIDEAQRLAGFRKFDSWAVEQGYEVALLQMPATIVHNKRVKVVHRPNGWVLPYYWSMAT